MIINTRKTFFPIGQGCFYSEKIIFDNTEKTIVYDCGSLNIDHLAKEITYSDITEIDFLIISHFHKDHINGIEKLIKKCKTIKNVIIPKLDALDIAFYLGTKNTIEEILIDPETFFGNDTNIIRINNNEEQTTLREDETLPLEISHSTSLPIFSKATNSPLLWYLKFYVDPFVYSNISLTNKQKKLIEETKNIDDYAKNKVALKKVYEIIGKKDFNLTSLSMASFPNSDFIPFICPHEYIVSVMNGDILLDTDDKILRYTQHYSELKNFIIDFHIPHHGSHKNIFRVINEWNLKRAIISAGYNNQFGHPSGVVLRKFQDSIIPVIVLTEYDLQITKRQYYVGYIVDTPFLIGS